MDYIVKEFLQEHGIEHLFEEFMDLLVSNDQLRYKIFRDYERDCHRDDVRFELSDMDIEYTDNIVESITDEYEDRLMDLEDWHIVLQETIKDFVGV